MTTREEHDQRMHDLEMELAEEGILIYSGDYERAKLENDWSSMLKSQHMLKFWQRVKERGHI